MNEIIGRKAEIMRLLRFLAILSFAFLAVSFLIIKQLNYVDYFHKTNEAELFIVKGNYNDALNIYKALFIDYKQVFYMDVHNACVCAIKLGKTKLAVKYAKMLILYGYELEDFEKEPFNLIKNKRFWSNFENDYTILRNEYLQTVDIELREKYYNLFLKDQSIGSRNLISQDSMLYDLSIDISELIEKYGFPDWMTKKDSMIGKLSILSVLSIF
ncbi:MAG: hypothetical protein FWH18_04680 [Marinilabiliaceae bacterium]|nr:hypothetical protein [Marinilabiliaceae bacterium]